MDFLFWRSPRPAAPSAPTPLLNHLAGAFAHQVAALYPSPHSDFLAATSDRRHLVYLALAREKTLTPAQAQGALSWRLSRAVEGVLGSRPSGLERALAHMGETAWTTDGYSALLALLDLPATGKLIRHAEKLEEAHLLAWIGLPRPLLNAGMALQIKSPLQSQLVAEALRLVAERDGQDSLERTIKLWSEAKCGADLYDEIDLDFGVAPVEGPALPPPFKPVLTRQAVRDLGRKYQNCLRRGGHIENSAYYEWEGDPAVVMRLVNDPYYGWTLDEARLARNQVVSAETEQTIIAALKAANVIVGHSIGQLRDDLWDALCDQKAVDLTPEGRLVRCFGKRVA